MRAKFVYEKFSEKSYPINEKFTEKSDPVEDLGIGIKSKLKQYSIKNKVKNSIEGKRLAALITGFSKIPKQNLYYIDREKTDYHFLQNYFIKEIDHIETDILDLQCKLFKISFDDNTEGHLIKLTNKWSETYYGDLNVAIKIYKLG
jgi:lipopolysaccharide export LptBFGC system permease protein LptF